MSGYDRPSAKPDTAPAVRVSFWARCETDRGVIVSPSFPLERDVRDWWKLHVAKGEVRAWRREVKGGTARDVELRLMEAA